MRRQLEEDSSLRPLATCASADVASRRRHVSLLSVRPCHVISAASLPSHGLEIARPAALRRVVAVTWP